MTRPGDTCILVLNAGSSSIKFKVFDRCLTQEVAGVAFAVERFCYWSLRHARLHSDSSKVAVWVIPAREEEMIARDALSLREAA